MFENGGGPDRTRICDLYRVKVRKSISCRQRSCVFRNLQKDDLDSNWTPRRVLYWFGLQADSRICFRTRS